MTHPINGLDDLLYVVMFGARPFRQADGGGDPVTVEQIVRHDRVPHLAAHHADPVMVMAAAEAASEGRTIAFADPLGMYISTFASGCFSLDDADIPAEWVRLSRGSRRNVAATRFRPCRTTTRASSTRPASRPVPATLP